ncbi:bacterial extracellular solute-binding s, 5 Middle family protein, partial [Chlamydia psittaci 84-8471/1]
DKESLVSTIF